MSSKKRNNIITAYTIGVIRNKDLDYDERVLVTIELTEDTKHNMDRPLLIDKYNARYFCNKVKTIDIEDIDGKKYKEAESFLYIVNKVIHKVGEISTNGDVPYYFNKERILKYKLYLPSDGLYESYSDNGMLTTRCTFKNNKYDGLFEMFYIDGSKLFEINYKEGLLHGSYKKYFINGVIEYEMNYKDNKKHGYYIKRNRENQILIDSNYHEDMLDGVYKEYFSSGQIKRDFIIVDGKISKQETYNLMGELTDEEIDESDEEMYRRENNINNNKDEVEDEDNEEEVEDIKE